MNNFNQQIAPFEFIAHHDGSYSATLDINDYKADLFSARKDEGFEENGYDWQALANVFLEEQRPNLLKLINFDSENSTFYAYTENNKEALKYFILAFHKACENDELIRDLFSRAELD